MSEFEIPDHGPTPPLADFLAAYREDDNWWWRSDCGHHQNWFEAAVEERDEALAALERAREYATAWRHQHWAQVVLDKLDGGNDD